MSMTLASTARSTGSTRSTRSTSHASAPTGWLRTLVDSLQAASCGTPEFDRLLARAPIGSPQESHCTTDLNDALNLLPPGCNFSLGRRDGVFWAWSQPNDDWQPAPGEARHDHPGGSGLIVAQTAALAITCAALVMHDRGMAMAAAEAGDRCGAA